MIRSKSDYKEYLEVDSISNHICHSVRKKMLITWQYIKCMRKLEYIHNCKKGGLFRALEIILKYRFYRLSVKSGLTIPINTFGKGLYIAHHGAVVVNPTARFGDNCVLQNGVNVSNDVVGGNHIYLGAGAKVMIGVHIADDVVIGANAVVTKDITTPNVVVAGIPAKVISHKGFKDRIQV